MKFGWKTCFFEGGMVTETNMALIEVIRDGCFLCWAQLFAGSWTSSTCPLASPGAGGGRMFHGWCSPEVREEVTRLPGLHGFLPGANIWWYWKPLWNPMKNGNMGCSNWKPYETQWTRYDIRCFFFAIIFCLWVRRYSPTASRYSRATKVSPANSYKVVGLNSLYFHIIGGWSWSSTQ